MTIKRKEIATQRSDVIGPAHPRDDPRVCFPTTAPSRDTEPANVSVYGHADIELDGAHRLVRDYSPHNVGKGTRSARTTFNACESDNEHRFDRLWDLQMGRGHTWENDSIAKQAVERDGLWGLCDAILQNCEVKQWVRQPALKRVITTDLRGFNRYYNGLAGACVGFAALLKHDTAEEAANSFLAERAASVVPAFDIETVTKLLSYVFEKYGEN